MSTTILKKLWFGILLLALSLGCFLCNNPSYSQANPVSGATSIGNALNGSIVTIRPHGYFCEANVNDDGLFQGNALHLFGTGTSCKHKLERVDGDWYRIRTMNYFIENDYAKHNVWDVDGRSKKSGAVLHVWESFSDSIPDSRQWRFLQNDDKTFYIVNKNSGLYLALEGSGEDKDGTKLIQSSEPVAWDVDVLSTENENASALSTHALSSSWMKNVADNTSLSDMTIPGAHDAGTCSLLGNIQPKFSHFECQQLYLDEQLAAGIRFFDMRLGTSIGSEKDPNINHGGVYCLDHDGNTLTFSKSVAYFRNFLKKHPSETLLMMVSHSGGKTDDQTSALYKAIQNNPELFYVGSSVPTLGEVRGKIVVIRRFEPTGADASKSEYGLDLSDWGSYDPQFKKTKGLVKIASYANDEVWVQDYYSTTATTKIDYVTGSFGDAERVQADAHSRGGHAYVLNYSSCTKSNPFTAARNMNKKLYANSVLNDAKSHFLGIVVMDFVNARQAEQIWQENFK